MTICFSGQAFLVVEDAMSKIRDEVVKVIQAFVEGFGEKGKLPLPPARFIDTHLCGCANRPREACGPRERRCARHLECRRPCE